MSKHIFKKAVSIMEPKAVIFDMLCDIKDIYTDNGEDVPDILKLTTDIFSHLEDKINPSSIGSHVHKYKDPNETDIYSVIYRVDLPNPYPKYPFDNDFLMIDIQFRDNKLYLVIISKLGLEPIILDCMSGRCRLRDNQFTGKIGTKLRDKYQSLFEYLFTFLNGFKNKEYYLLYNYTEYDLDMSFFFEILPHISRLGFYKPYLKTCYDNLYQVYKKSITTLLQYKYSDKIVFSKEVTDNEEEILHLELDLPSVQVKMSVYPRDDGDRFNITYSDAKLGENIIVYDGCELRLVKSGSSDCNYVLNKDVLETEHNDRHRPNITRIINKSIIRLADYLWINYL